MRDKKKCLGVGHDVIAETVLPSSSSSSSSFFSPSDLTGDADEDELMRELEDIVAASDGSNVHIVMCEFSGSIASIKVRESFLVTNLLEWQ